MTTMTTPPAARADDAPSNGGAMSGDSVGPTKCPFSAAVRGTKCFLGGMLDRAGLGRFAPGSAEPLGVRLKAKTQRQHDAAESHAFHAVLFGSLGPRVAREAYTRNLWQHKHLQGTFEPMLRGVAGGRLGSMLKPYHAYARHLEEDLAFLGMPEGAAEVLPATHRFERFIASCSGRQSHALIGVWYVFEGATNGGTVIAKRLREGLGLPEDCGTRYINPHGSAVRPRWVAWKADLHAQRFSARQEREIIEAARRTFDLTGEVMGDVLRRMDVAPVA